MPYRFFLADVFTEQAFAGNQLAVFPDARGIADRAMQAIAREFNFPETTFVLPAQDARHACRVRIFTPKAEIPFAGHPTVGTAAVMTRLGAIKPPKAILEEGVGPVPVEIELRGERVHARLVVERDVEVPAVSPAKEHAAAVLSLPAAAVVDTWFASGGLRFAFIRLADRGAVDRAILDRSAWSSHFARAWAASLYLFTGEREIYSRMFAPGLGVDEDPATGSAAVALAGVLASREGESEGDFAYPIEQGVAMGRPSRLEASAEKRGGRVVRIKVGGATCIVGEGAMEIPAGY